MNNLKSCPFCGGVAKLNAPGYKFYSPYWCKCTQCGAEGPIKLSGIEAEKGWNERVKDDVEQEAIPPVRESDSVPGELASWWYVCGACGRGVDYHDRFCRHCGKGLKWE